MTVRQGPLAGMRVMDVSIMAAGPWTAALLGMLGEDHVNVFTLNRQLDALGAKQGR